MTRLISVPLKLPYSSLFSCCLASAIAISFNQSANNGFVFTVSNNARSCLVNRTTNFSFHVRHSLILFKNQNSDTKH